jgi:hypothetical protein
MRETVTVAALLPGMRVAAATVCRNWSESTVGDGSASEGLVCRITTLNLIKLDLSFVN